MMKFVRTARSYRSLSVDVGDDEKSKSLTVTGTPQEVSDENADKLKKAGATVGVDVLVFDSQEEASEGVVHRAAQSGQAPDLSAGIALVTGVGDPVSAPDSGFKAGSGNPVSTPDGDTPSQAGQPAGDTPPNAGGTADQPNTPPVSARSGKPASGTTTTEGN